MTLDPFAMLAEAIAAREQPWRQNAACRGLPTSWFYPARGCSPDPRALKACAACAVRNECWADGQRENYGTWAGVAVKARRRPPPINHGTPGGYITHLRRGEDACRLCREAHSGDVNARKYGAA